MSSATRRPAAGETKGSLDDGNNIPGMLVRRAAKEADTRELMPARTHGNLAYGGRCALPWSPRATYPKGRAGKSPLNRSGSGEVHTEGGTLETQLLRCTSRTSWVRQSESDQIDNCLGRELC